MMQVYNFPQNTPAWQQIRLGKLTASHAQAIGNNGKGLQTLCKTCAFELINGFSLASYKSNAMERGQRLEDDARKAFECKTGKRVHQVGFVQFSALSGCSPDGLVEDDVLIEIKALTDKIFRAYSINGKINSSHWWQMQLQMLQTGRNLCYYVVYNPNFKDNLIIKKVYADKSAQAKLLKGLSNGEAQIRALLANTTLVYKPVITTTKIAAANTNEPFAWDRAFAVAQKAAAALVVSVIGTAIYLLKL